VKNTQITLNEFGQYLGSDKKNFIVYKDKKPLKRIPFYMVKQVILTPGNTVSTSALFWCSVYNVNLMMASNTGRPLSMMLPLTSSAHVKTRIKQYEAYYSSKGVEIAKAILSAKINNQIALLERLGFDGHKLDYLLVKLSKIKGGKIDNVRTRLMGIESRVSKPYFNHLRTLFPKFLQTPKRMKYHAEDPLNNLLNLGYEVLKGEVYRGVMYAHLDPYLGYLHSIQFAKPSLVCDIQEIFRGMIDEFLIGYAQKLNEDDFEDKNGRMFLKREESYKLIKAINGLFDKRIEHQRIKKYGKYSTVRTAIREEAIKLGQYLRDEKEEYPPYFTSFSRRF
jgi:CRISPR-associated protein Cas1